MRLLKPFLGVSLAAGLVGAASVSAHDGWLELVPAEPDNENRTEIALQIGHGNERRSIDLTPLPNWVRKAVIVSPAESSGGLETHDVERNTGLVLNRDGSGTQVIAVTTFAFTNEMPSGAFNEYLRQEGLVKAIEDRERRGTLGEVGREIYRRTAKLVSVDGDPGDSDIATVPIGLNLEIVPQCRPVDDDCGPSLPVQLLFYDRPLAGARVVLNDLSSNEWPTAVSKTDSDGMAHFDLPHDGDWLISTIWSWPVMGDQRGDYETIFSSLVFSRPKGAKAAMAKLPGKEGFTEQNP